MLSKAQIRDDHKALRALMSEAVRNQLSIKLLENLRDWLTGKPEISQVHLFLPIERLREVNTFPMFYELQQKGYTLYTSKLDENGNRLLTLDITAVTQFMPDRWGIPEPNAAIETTADQIQLVLVPLLAYDRVGHRLGYGKGYYDSFLASISQSVYKVGLSFFDPISEIPAEDHDIPLDFCISPTQIHQF